MFSVLPDCDRVVKMHWLGVYQSLPTRMRPGYWLHLLLCGPCRRYGNEIEAFRGKLAEDPDAPPLSQAYRLRPESRSRMAQHLQEHLDSESEKDPPSD